LLAQKGTPAGDRYTNDSSNKLLFANLCLYVNYIWDVLSKIKYIELSTKMLL